MKSIDKVVLPTVEKIAARVYLVMSCVTVKAPDKPIEINLNINVKQEVVVSLKKDAEDFIANNPDLFPK